MCQENSLSEAICGNDLQDICKCRYYEDRLNSVIFPELHCNVDIQSHVTLPNLHACFYNEKQRVILYVPANRSFSVEEMAEAVFSAYGKPSPSLPELIISLEKDPREVERLKKLLNGKIK